MVVVNDNPLNQYDTLYNYYNPSLRNNLDGPAFQFKNDQFQVELLTELIDRQPKFIYQYYYHQLRLFFPDLIVELILDHLIFKQQESLRARRQKLIPVKLKVYGVNYNIVRVMSGLSGMCYSI